MGLSIYSQDDSPHPRSRLLQLPAELRSQILRHLVTQPDPLDLRNLRAPLGIDLNVMYVCKQLRDEARVFLYRENTLEVVVDSGSKNGKIACMHFSRHHMICEYRAEEAVKDVLSIFFERFLRFQFRFADARQLESLRKIINTIKHYLYDKHITIMLPPPKVSRFAQQGFFAQSVSLYPRMDNPLSCFSVIRCASMSVSSPILEQDLTQHEKFIDLVTSDKPVIDMVREYDAVQRSARTVVKMLVPDGVFSEYEPLRDHIFASLAALCKNANQSDQDAFLLEQENFQNYYQQIEDLQWRVV